MTNNLLLGLGRYMLPIPSLIWHRQVAQDASHNDASLGFMSEEHHLVRNLVVRELPRVGKPLSAEWICGQTNLPLERVVTILDELEQHMTFLYRNPQGEVVWAYPVTVEKTPHQLTFATGEQVYAA